MRQQLPKSPHPNAKFEIIPDVLHEIRAERRTSFRSPTKSHEIKVAEKKGIRDIGTFCFLCMFECFFFICFC